MISNTSKDMNVFHADIKIENNKTESDGKVFEKMKGCYLATVSGSWGKRSLRYWTKKLHGVHRVNVTTVQLSLWRDGLIS
jgi:hypothetical protein